MKKTASLYLTAADQKKLEALQKKLKAAKLPSSRYYAMRFALHNWDNRRAIK